MRRNVFASQAEGAIILTPCPYDPITGHQPRARLRGRDRPWIYGQTGRGLAGKVQPSTRLETIQCSHLPDLKPSSAAIYLT